MKPFINTLSAALLLTVLFACSGEKRPFEAEYTSPNDVIITYQGKTYRLNKFAKTANTPFRYSFERDGDLDIVIDGQEYEVDSPYDDDKKKRSKKSRKKKRSKRK